MPWVWRMCIPFLCPPSPSLWLRNKWSPSYCLHMAHLDGWVTALVGERKDRTVFETVDGVLAFFFYQVAQSIYFLGECIKYYKAGHWSSSCFSSHQSISRVQRSPSNSATFNSQYLLLHPLQFYLSIHCQYVFYLHFPIRLRLQAPRRGCGSLCSLQHS